MTRMTRALKLAAWAGFQVAVAMLTGAAVATAFTPQENPGPTYCNIETYQELWPAINTLHEQRNYLYGIVQNPAFAGGHLRGDRAEYEQRVVNLDAAIDFIDARVRECLP